MELLSKFGMLTEVLDEIVESNPALKGSLLGYLAEYKLMEQIRAYDMIESVEKIPDADKNYRSDLLVKTKCGQNILIEVKSITRYEPGEKKHTSVNHAYRSKASFQLDGEPIRTNYRKYTSTDILAVCRYHESGALDFVFVDFNKLPNTSSSTIPENLRKHFPIQSVKIPSDLSTLEPCMSTTIHPLISSVTKKRALENEGPL